MQNGQMFEIHSGCSFRTLSLQNSWVLAAGLSENALSLTLSLWMTWILATFLA